MDTPITLLVVDDHALIRAAIQKLLIEKNVQDIVIIGEASNGEDAIQIARKTPPDVVLLDIGMPGMSGVEVTRRLLQIHPSIKIIALTAHEEELFPAQLLKTGAVGYLTKDTNSDELIKAIRTVVQNQRYITPRIAAQMANKYIQGTADSALENLSHRELEILLMISQGRKVEEIAEKLFISAKTVNTYRYRLFEKLKVQNDVELTKLALDQGLVDIK